MSALKKGVLITTASSEKINSMTIAEGMLGIEWEKLFSEMGDRREI